MPCRSIVVSEYGPAENLILSEKELPPLEEHQVLIKVEAAGVNPSDTYQRLGPDGPWAATPHLLPTLPYTPGKDGAGTVKAIGPGVVEFNIGDRVYTNGSLTGTFAEYAVCSVGQCFALPDNISFAQGAGVGVPCATAYRAIWQRAMLRPTESLFVHGASGAVGLAAVQMAVAAGCFVCGTAGSPAGEAAVAAAGAQCVVNHKTNGYLEKAKAALPEGSNGYDVLLENAAHANLSADCGVLARHARLCIVGSKAEPTSFNPRLTMPNELDIRGVFLSVCTPEEVVAIHAELFTLMEAGKLSPVVGLELGLDEAPKSHIEVMAPSAGGAVGNIVVLPQRSNQSKL